MIHKCYTAGTNTAAASHSGVSALLSDSVFIKPLKISPKYDQWFVNIEYKNYKISQPNINPLLLSYLEL